MKNKIKKSVALTTLILTSFYGGWQIKEISNSMNFLKRPDPTKSNGAWETESDESTTVHTIDSMLLQAISYGKVCGNFPEQKLIEIPIGASVIKGNIADQYGQVIHYAVSNNVLEVRSVGKDGHWGSSDDIVGRVSLDRTWRYITSKDETFSCGIEH